MSSETMLRTGTITRKTGAGTALLLSLAVIGAAIFLVVAAFPYFGMNQQRFGVYWPKRGWLLLHIVPAMIALATGPFVLWLGLNRRRMKLHRGLGVVYMSSIAVSSIAAFYLATHTDFGWVFGAGLTGLATAWLLTTGLALISIRKHLIAQHQEWMIRSYVVTFAFVNFRWFFSVLEAAGVGTALERATAASWFCWAVPLLVTELALQGRKIFKVKAA
jgi:hypothetical protein